MAKDPLIESLEALLAADAAELPEPDEQQVRAAVAVLLVDVVLADGQIRHDEHRALGHALQRVLGLSAAQADALLRRGEEAMARSLPFKDVVGIIARCSYDVKKKVVHALWRVAFADAELQGSEEYLVRKIAEHIGLATADLVETKLRAREEFIKEEL
jgi:uncharacterized tellurite resistance protein B-like protein